MTCWQIPAKTFLIGEYAAVFGCSAVVMTTTPFFEVTLTNTPGLKGIHPDSPAGQYWQSQPLSRAKGLDWYDPYHGVGGLGASTAQFLGAYLAVNQGATPKSLLCDYQRVAWNGEGMRPSGYDVLAQSNGGIVAIDGETKTCRSLGWSFDNAEWILIHTGKKLATHTHLQEMSLNQSLLKELRPLIELALDAFKTNDEMHFIDAINGYYQALLKLGLVAEHTKKAIQELRRHCTPLAIKGCGAMGADTILLITSTEKAEQTYQTLINQDWQVLARASQSE